MTVDVQRQPYLLGATDSGPKPYFPLPSIMVAGMLIISVPLFSTWSEKGLSWIPQILSALLLGVYVIERAILRGKVLQFPVSLRCYFGWVLFAGLSMGFQFTESSHPLQWLLYLTTFKVSLLAVLLACVVRSRKDLMFILWCLSMSVFVVVVLNYQEIRDIQKSVAITSAATEEQRLAGTLGNANSLAMYSVMVGWASTMVYFSMRRGALRWIPLMTLPLVCFLIFYTGSRKGILAIPLSVVLAQYFVVRHTMRGSFGKQIIMISLAFVLAALLFSAFLRSPYGHRFGVSMRKKSDEVSAQIRGSFIRAGFRMWVEHPILGVRYEGFRYLAGRYGSISGFYSHSTPIELLSCTGLIGFVLYGSGLLFLFYEVWRGSRLARDPADAVLLRCALGALLVIYFFHLFAVLHSSRLIWPFMGAIAGYASHVYRSSRLHYQADDADPA